ncbi:MAG TPA: response regulator [Clostridiales bacterium]|nr:response regulator [Clostridiales bacterium]HPV01086.1 response regulator [Clostridiales bacterium]
MINIGICDDLPINREIIKAIIQQYGKENDQTFSIWEFGSGEELVGFLNDNDISFDLVFLDYYMKELTGLETAIKIRQMEHDGSKPACNIVFVTATENTLGLMSVRPLRILQKPVSPGTINAILTFVLSEKCKT